MRNLVSIITPVYNSSKFLKENIESVQKQTFVDYEHILIDDCSSDNSVEMIECYNQKDARIKLIKLSKNSGAGVARNKGIKEANGRFIAFLDSDDLWDENKLKKQLNFMLENKSFFSFTSYEKISESGKRTGKVVSYPKEELTYERALFNNPIGCLTAMYDTDFYGKCYMPEIRKRQDYALWLKLLKLSKAHYLCQNLSFYRNRKGSISSKKFNLIKYQWKVYRELEELSFFKSAFYLFTSVLNKLLKESFY
ncbi:glycosyltransferase family 2 protein [Galbibacter sp. BG1]